MRKTKEIEIDEGVFLSSISTEDDYCENCGASTANISSESWWGDQDGIHIICEECGHHNFISNGLFEE